MELEKGWPKVWKDIKQAGVLPGVDEHNYGRRYEENSRALVRPFLLHYRGPILSAEAVAEVHQRQFANLTPWAGEWAAQAIIGEHRGSPGHRTALELRLLEDQTRRLLRQIDPANLDHIARVAAFFHARFESIHPFPDGNGRVGRALAAHFIQLTTAAVGIGGTAGLSKGNHPDKLAYVQALITARETNNLAPLARHYQFELAGRAEDLNFLPSPFRIAPKTLPAEAYARELRDSIREPAEAIAAPGLPLNRPWLQDAGLDSLKRFVPAEAKASGTFSVARKLLETNRHRSLSLGDALAVINEIRAAKPYILGLLARDVGAESYQRWVQEKIFAPFIRTLDVVSQARLRVAVKMQLADEDRHQPAATNTVFETVKSAAFLPPSPDCGRIFRTALDESMEAARKRAAPAKHHSKTTGVER